jgi:poly-gamma-glutamate synthesis protein (capsule biosynthesis protein)
MFTEVAPLLRSADTAVCHMEAPIAPPGSPVIVVPPVLSTAAPMADALAGAGFDRCSTAGNHIMDRGVAGIDATLAEFDRVGISQSGAARSPAEASPAAAIYDVDGVAVAHLSYSWAIGGQSVPASQPWRANTLSPGRVIADARAARAAGAQVVVTSFTWGFDKIVQPTPYQRSVAQAVTASGEVDLIVGQQAHVLQPIEQVNGVWVIYGMGNFLSDHPVGSFPQSAGDAAIFVVGVVVRPDGVVKVRPPVAYPTWIDKSNGHVVRPVEQRFDPSLSASTRAALQRSLDRTRSVLGPFVFERA